MLTTSPLVTPGLRARSRVTRLARAAAPGPALAVALTLALVAGSPAAAVPRTRAGTAIRGAAAQSAAAGVDPRMCHPYPPDYEGCSIPDQVRPESSLQFRTELTGHASNYRTYAMGEHRVSVFQHLAPKLDDRLAALYRGAVRAYERNNTKRVIGKDGKVHTLVKKPEFDSWDVFKEHAHSLCAPPDILGGSPFTYCSGWTSIGGTIDHALWSATKMFLGCSGAGVTVASGDMLRDVIAGVTTNIWRGGFATWTVTTAACLANHIPIVHHFYVGLWNFAKSLWGEPIHGKR